MRLLVKLGNSGTSASPFSEDECRDVCVRALFRQRLIPAYLLLHPVPAPAGTRSSSVRSLPGKGEEIKNVSSPFPVFRRLMRQSTGLAWWDLPPTGRKAAGSRQPRKEMNLTSNMHLT